MIRVVISNVKGKGKIGRNKRESGEIRLIKENIVVTYTKAFDWFKIFTMLQMRFQDYQFFVIPPIRSDINDNLLHIQFYLAIENEDEDCKKMFRIVPFYFNYFQKQDPLCKLLLYKGEMVMRPHSGLFEPLYNYYSKQISRLHSCPDKKADLSFEIQLILAEALTNALVHGNYGIPSISEKLSYDKLHELRIRRSKVPEYANKLIHFKHHFDGTRISLEIEDQGQGFDWKNQKIEPHFDNPNPGGMGLLLITSKVNEVQWNDKGNKISITKMVA